MNKLLLLLLATATSAAFAADPAAYKTATAKADSDYQAASKQCDSQSGNAKDICVQQAKSARAHAKADAVAQYKDTKKATEKAQIDVADAKNARNAATTQAKSDYRTAEANTDCSTLAGSEKASCMTHTKSAAAGEMVADSVITTKVKADLVKEPKLKSLDVHVDTVNGVVTLSGFVPSQSEADRAVQVARGVKGVSQVQNTLQVK